MNVVSRKMSTMRKAPSVRAFFCWVFGMFFYILANIHYLRGYNGNENELLIQSDNIKKENGNADPSQSESAKEKGKDNEN